MIEKIEGLSAFSLDHNLYRSKYPIADIDYLYAYSKELVQAFIEDSSNLSTEDFYKSIYLLSELGARFFNIPYKVALMDLSDISDAEAVLVTNVFSYTAKLNNLVNILFLDNGITIYAFNELGYGKYYIASVQEKLYMLSGGVTNDSNELTGLTTVKLDSIITCNPESSCDAYASIEEKVNYEDWLLGNVNYIIKENKYDKYTDRYFVSLFRYALELINSGEMKYKIKIANISPAAIDTHLRLQSIVNSSGMFVVYSIVIKDVEVLIQTDLRVGFIVKNGVTYLPCGEIDLDVIDIFE